MKCMGVYVITLLHRRRESMAECSNSVMLRKSIISGKHTNGELDSNDILQLLPEGENNKYQMGVSIEVEGDSYHGSAPYMASDFNENGSEDDKILEEVQDDEFTSFEVAEQRSSQFASPYQLYAIFCFSDEIAEIPYLSCNLPNTRRLDLRLPMYLLMLHRARCVSWKRLPSPVRELFDQ